MESLKFDIPWNQIDNNDEEALKFLLGRIDVIKPVIVEIGCWTGKSTSILATYAKRIGVNIVTIDDFSGEGSRLSEYADGIKPIFEQNMRNIGLQDNVSVIDSKSSDIVDELEDNSIDFLFIDGDHRYSQIKRDIDEWWPKIKIGGIMAGHDFDKDIYEEQYIELDTQDSVHHGVSKAVLETFPNYNLKARVWWTVK